VRGAERRGGCGRQELCALPLTAPLCAARVRAQPAAMESFYRRCGGGGAASAAPLQALQPLCSFVTPDTEHQRLAKVRQCALGPPLG
jgi:hypothetical protein